MAGIALNLQDLADHQDAELMRQKIAACFAVFRVQPDMGEGEIANPIGSSLRPGAVYDLGPGEDVRFGEPPGVNGFEEFSRVVLRSVASGLGITYEALTGDLSNVNFSSARMGRMEMDRNISSWQWTMMVPQFCQPLGEWFREAWMMQGNPAGLAEMRVSWVPPHRILVDPAREVGALVDKVRAGFASRQGVIRELGHDPERLLAEQAEDAAQADAAGLVFDSDPRRTSGTGLTQARPGEPVYPDQEGADE
jgi:lambda family phage portal protein